MSTTTDVLWRNQRYLWFWLKKVPYLELWLVGWLVGYKAPPLLYGEPSDRHRFLGFLCLDTRSPLFAIYAR